ncbi:unnamed protein product [Lupinus luteus]|uniref:cysteine dioxygenase n=1 Tax=Lupinus luteus TaxID=3873 RepID=A0AAV1XNW1_LUPLU
MEQGFVAKGRVKNGHVVSEVDYVKRVITRKRKPYRRVRKQVLTLSRTLQELFMACRETFNVPGMVPSPHHVQKLCHILDNMRSEDLGLSRDLQFFKPGNVIKENQRVTYTTVYKCDKFSLCIFFLPEKGVIPLHNHPEMTVFSKLLLGQMHIKSYDWVDPDASHNLLHQPSKLRLAKLKANSILKAPCDAAVLYPRAGGNIHEFTAITPCAVLDVIGPPYSREDGRDCSYYTDHPYAAFPNEGISGISGVNEEASSYMWLKEIEMPENSKMDGIEYKGPPITETPF